MSGDRKSSAQALQDSKPPTDKQHKPKALGAGFAPVLLDLDKCIRGHFRQKDRPQPTVSRLGSKGGDAERQKGLWPGLLRSTIPSGLERQAVPQGTEGQKGSRSRTEQHGQEERGDLTRLAMNWTEGRACSVWPGSQRLPEP